MPQTKAEIKEAFNLFDKNKDGTIAAEELRVACEALGHMHTDAEIQGMLTSLDKDGDGKLNLEEFTNLLCANTDDEEMRDAFNSFDKDGSGHITKDELRSAMSTMGGCKCSDEEVDEMIAAADSDKDGKVGFAEFKKMMTPQ